MKYVSTRGNADILGFEDVILSGLARDGGLYLPESWPQITSDEMRSMRGQTYQEVAARIMLPFVEESISQSVLQDLISKAYASFSHEAVVPLVQTGSNEFTLELFHGPTLAFKDVAMQFLGHLFEHVLRKRGQRMTIIGATSGDTGGAAIEAMKGREAVDIYMLHPKGRVSDVQRRMMTCVQDTNVHNIAIEGNFDDCQAIVKALFNDLEFRDRASLGGVNSINWARIMAQAVYYFTSALSLGAPDREVSFSVPTGNFGDIFAGFTAREMGLPVRELIIASNMNDILTRTFETGEYRPGKVEPSTSPSMDIQVSSNFERALYILGGRDPARTRAAMSALDQSGAFSLDEKTLSTLRQTFSAARASEDDVAETIKRLSVENNYLIDPHTAVGLFAGRKVRKDGETPLVVLSTAHPAKFPEAVERISTIRPDLPTHMNDLFEREEKCVTLENNPDAVKALIEKKLP